MTIHDINTIIKHIVIVLLDETNAHANYNPGMYTACTNANNVDIRLYELIYTYTRRNEIVSIFWHDIC
jgi:hypothetical protein